MTPKYLKKDMLRIEKKNHVLIQVVSIIFKTFLKIKY